MGRSGAGPGSGWTGSRWTVLSVSGAAGGLAVDTTGRAVTGRHGWSLNWVVSAGERHWEPTDAASRRQRAFSAGGCPAVALETVFRAGDGDFSQLSYVALAAGGVGAVGVLEFRNDTSAPLALTLSVQPGDFWRAKGLRRVEVDNTGVLANRSRVLWWQRPPTAWQLFADVATAASQPERSALLAAGSPRMYSRSSRASAELSWPVTHRSKLRVVLPLDPSVVSPAAPAAVPTLEQVGRGWDLHLAKGLRLAGLPDGRIEELTVTALRRLLSLDLGRSAAGIPEQHLAPGERTLVGAALASAGHASRAAELVPLRAARSPAKAARLVRRELAQITDPPTTSLTAGVSTVRALAEAAGPGGGWAGQHGGDDPTRRAAFLLAVRDVLIAERDGYLDLLAGYTAVDLAEARPAIEVHHLGTSHGLLSFAIRWHGAVPALLWELLPPRTRLEAWACALVSADGGADRLDSSGLATSTGPRLRARVLSSSWETNQLSGEALLHL